MSVAHEKAISSVLKTNALLLTKTPKTRKIPPKISIHGKTTAIKLIDQCGNTSKLAITWAKLVGSSI
jgi:hypothetical protein